MRKSAIYVLLFMVLLMAAVVICFIRIEFPDSGEAEAQETWQIENTDPVVAKPVDSALPDPTERVDATPPVTTTPTVEPTAQPTAKPTAAPTVAPTPIVTETPRTLVNQGSFASDTGTALNIVVRWAAYTAGGGNTELEIDISASHYSFYTSALPGSITLTVNGASYTLGSPEIQYGGDAQLSTLLCEKTLSITSDSVDIGVVWSYRGSYGGTELDEISAYGTANIG